MRKGQTPHFLLAAIFLSTTVLTADITGANEILWSPETPLTTHPSQDMSPCIMQAANGTIWVVWVSNRMGLGNDELFYKTSSNYGLQWSPDTRLTYNQSVDSTPSIMQASNGTIWVAWASDRTENYELFYKTFSGSSWSPDIQLTEEPSRDVEPSIIQVTSGLIWVVWCSYRSGNADLFYKIYNGSTWSTETQLTYDLQPDKHPSVTQGSDGAIWVVWCSYSNTTESYELFYETFNGTAWSSDTQLTDDSLYDMGPSIAQARDGMIWVVWQRDTSDLGLDELYYKIYDGSTWSFDTQLTNYLADDMSPSIAQINDRKIWVVWEANRDDDYDIYYKTSSEIKVPGDVNGDGIVDEYDLARIREAYGSKPGDSDWDAEADLTNDQVIDLYDLAILGKNYGN